MLKKFKFKLYFRKSSFKKDLNSAKILFGEIENYKPKNFLEVGVFQGVTSRNVCEKLNIIHKNQFNYYGVDVFGIRRNHQVLDDYANQKLQPSDCLLVTGAWARIAQLQKQKHDFVVLEMPLEASDIVPAPALLILRLHSKA